MPSKSKNTPTKESDEAAAAAAEIADLKAQLAAALQAAQPPSGGIITTPAPTIGSNNPWGAPGRNTNLPPLSVAPQAATSGPARTLALEEKEPPSLDRPRGAQHSHPRVPGYADALAD